MRRSLALLLLALICETPLFAAEIYRCTDATGKVEYRDAPCASTAASAKVDVRHAAPTADAEANRARIVQENADFNARRIASGKPQREVESVPYRSPREQISSDKPLQPASSDKPRDPASLPYPANACGGVGVPRCRVDPDARASPGSTRPPTTAAGAKPAT